MSRTQTLQALFKRYRRPGDLVFAVAFMLLSFYLLSQIGEQTVWKKRTSLFSQPAFWPTASLIGMSLFATLHWIGSACSARIPGRWAEVGFWAQSIEYALWFMLYVFTVPYLGYLPSTLVFAALLVLRSGYRSTRTQLYAALSGLVIVLVFKSFLQVKIPGGALYEYLPGALRTFMLSYL